MLKLTLIEFGSSAFWNAIGDSMELQPGQGAQAPHVSPWTAITDNNPATRPTAAPAPQAMPELRTLRDLGAQQQTASSFVRMRAPNGEEADVPSHEEQLFTAQGAQRLS
jgi:hypothetical protein